MAGAAVSKPSTALMKNSTLILLLGTGMLTLLARLGAEPAQSLPDQPATDHATRTASVASAPPRELTDDE